MIRVLRMAALVAALWTVCGTAAASGLQVSPVSLTLEARQNAAGLWLSNTGDNVVHAQVRVYQWTQAGEDHLTPSRNLVVSPPMLQLAPGGKQLVRVIRVGPPPAGTAEDAYRIAVDELPIQTADRKGLEFVLHYSIPVFVEPTGKSEVAPDLQWSLQREGPRAALVVSNTGTGHAQLADLVFTDRAGQRTEIARGLLGYVLPHSTMHWELKSAPGVFANGGTLEARINGKPAIQNLSLAGLTR